MCFGGGGGGGGGGGAAAVVAAAPVDVCSALSDVIPASRRSRAFNKSGLAASSARARPFADSSAIVTAVECRLTISLIDCTGVRIDLADGVGDAGLDAAATFVVTAGRGLAFGVVCPFGGDSRPFFLGDVDVRIVGTTGALADPFTLDPFKLRPFKLDVSDNGDGVVIAGNPEVAAGVVMERILVGRGRGGGRNPDSGVNPCRRRRRSSGSRSAVDCRRTGSTENCEDEDASDDGKAIVNGLDGPGSCSGGDRGPPSSLIASRFINAASP